MKNKQTESQVRADQNYLDLIPVHNDSAVSFQTDEEGRVTLLKENTGLMNRMAQAVFHKPRVSSIHLDEMGNFIWPLMDGQRSVFTIAQCVKEKFGPEAEPLYERLIRYLNILQSYSFILLQRPDEE